jgi:hypothetical protein
MQFPANQLGQQILESVESTKYDLNLKTQVAKTY